LRKKLTSQQTFTTEITNDSEFAVKASYAVYEIIAKRLKPYSDGEFVKERLEVMGTTYVQKKKQL
jgi:hypothetical protein